MKNEFKDIMELEADIKDYEEDDYGGIFRDGEVKGEPKKVYHRGIFVTGKEKTEKLKRALHQKYLQGYRQAFNLRHEQIKELAENLARDYARTDYKKAHGDFLRDERGRTIGAMLKFDILKDFHLGLSQKYRIEITDEAVRRIHDGKFNKKEAEK